MLTAKKIKFGFDGAAGGRLLGDWSATGNHEDAVLRWTLPTLRNRARDFERNSDYIRNYIDLCVTNIAGPKGFQLLVNNPDFKLNKKIQDHWFKFSEKCDNTGTRSLTFLTYLIVRALKRDGEIFARIVKGKFNNYNLAIQLIESDYIDENYNDVLKNGNVVRMGIELDKWNKPIAYYVTEPDRNGEIYGHGMLKGHYYRVPAEEMIHIYSPVRAYQSRGYSRLSSVLFRTRMLKGLEEAGITNARIGASKMGFLTKKGEIYGEYAGDGEDSDGNLINKVSPGIIEELPPGIEFQSFNPEFPSNTYDTFIERNLLALSAGLGVTYQSLTGDRRSVNYSSDRSGLLQERDGWQIDQTLLIETFFTPLFRKFLRQCNLTNMITTNEAIEAEDYFTFVGRDWDWVDPLKDINAQIRGVEMGLLTRREIYAKKGKDIEEVALALKEEREIFKKYGINFEGTNVNETDN